MSALKDLNGKQPVIEFPLSAMEAGMRGFGDGKSKYAYMDWLKGHSAKDLLSAIIRHVSKMMWESETALDSGLNHMDHIIANAAMYIEQQRRGTLKKDLLTQEKNYFEVGLDSYITTADIKRTIDVYKCNCSDNPANYADKL